MTVTVPTLVIVGPLLLIGWALWVWAVVEFSRWARPKIHQRLMKHYGVTRAEYDRLKERA